MSFFRHLSQYFGHQTTEAGTSNEVLEIDSCDLRIRTLSTVLNNMHQAHSLTTRSSRKEVPAFLRHIAVLLTRGTDIDGDKEVKDAVAVTATTEESSLKLLVVPQNSPNARQNDSEPFKLDITTIKRNSRTLEQIYNSICTSQSIKEYIADLLELFHSIDPHNPKDMKKFRAFVTIRCINKLQSRLNSEKKRWNSPLQDTLGSWRPTVEDKVEAFWIAKPDWELAFDDEIEKHMKTRDVNGNVEWEFSIDTAHLWSWILAMILSSINQQITEYRNALRKQHPKEILGTVEVFIILYNGLSLLVIRFERVIKALLAIPSLRSSFLPAKPTDSNIEGEDDDEDVVELPEANDSPADGVYYYLKSLVAWAVALYQLLQPDLLKIFSAISVDVVLVTGFRSDIMTADEIVSGLLERHPNSQNIIETFKPYLETNLPSFFPGAIHSEATLMGLISYFSPDDDAEHIRSDTEILNFDTFKKDFRPALVNLAIAAEKKCCWCCDKLSQLVNPTVLIPRSNGAIYPWCPPRIGIGLGKLEVLETQLWTKLYEELMQKHRGARAVSFSRSIDDDSLLLDLNMGATPKFLLSSNGTMSRLAS